MSEEKILKMLDHTKSEIQDIIKTLNVLPKKPRIIINDKYVDKRIEEMRSLEKQVNEIIRFLQNLNIQKVNLSENNKHKGLRIEK